MHEIHLVDKFNIEFYGNKIIHNFFFFKINFN